MQLIDGKATATAIKAEIAEEVKKIVAQGGKQPHLAAVLVGHDAHFAMDLALSLQAVHDHPIGVYDRSRDEIVPDASLRRSDCEYFSLNFSVALCF